MDINIHVYIHTADDLQLIVDHLRALQLIEDQKTELLKTAVDNVDNFDITPLWRASL
jgi:hypothetical protein